MHPPRGCAATGCTAIRGPHTFSPYCQRHRQALRRHGHPLQRAISIRLLEPYARTVRATHKANPDSALFAILEKRWELLLDMARALAAERASGKAHHGPTGRAAEMLLKIAAVVPFHAVAEAVLSVVIFEDRHRTAFRDDRAFRFALVRRLRHLAPMSKGSHWNNRSKRVSLVYRDAPPKQVEAIGHWLVEVFGVAGRLVSEQYSRLATAPDKDQERIAQAVAGLRSRRK